MKIYRSLSIAALVFGVGFVAACAPTIVEDATSEPFDPVPSQDIGPTSTTEPSGIDLEALVVTEVDQAEEVSSNIDTESFIPEILEPSPVSRQTTIPTPPPAPHCAEFTIPGVDFESGRDELSMKAKTILRKLFDDHLERPHTSIGELLLAGHTDARPYDGPGGNQGLSERRAQAVWDQFLRLGLDPSIRVSIIGHADRLPVASGDSPQALALNRRVELFVLCS